MALPSLLMICAGLTACGHDIERLQSAAAEKAISEVGTTLPDYPSYCAEKTVRVRPQEGDKWRGVQLRWEGVADAEDARKSFCRRFYQNVQTKFGATR